MPFPRPSFADLISSAQADTARMPGADLTLRRSMLAVLAYMIAAQASGEYDYLDWMVANVLLPDSATGAYLDRWANIVGLQREAPAPATGAIIFSGTSTYPVPEGTEAQTSNSQVIVSTTAAGTIGGGGTVTIAAAAVAGGADGNLPTGAPLTLLTAISGVVGTASVAAPGFTGGADQETDSALRVRVLQRLSSPPQGGAAYDYVAWAEEVAGVTRVWVYPAIDGAGTVGITFTMDGRGNVIPLSADVTNVQNSVLASCPVTATPTTFAPTGSAVAVNIHGLTASVGFTVAAAEANIETALAALFATTTPGGYAWDGNAEAYLTGGALYLSQIYGAINSAAGVATFDLTAPSADQEAGFGVLLELGAVTWT